jgi:hypothetical protein
MSTARLGSVTSQPPSIGYSWRWLIDILLWRSVADTLDILITFSCHRYFHCWSSRIYRAVTNTSEFARLAVIPRDKGAFGREHLTPIDGKHLELEFTVWSTMWFRWINLLIRVDQVIRQIRTAATPAHDLISIWNWPLYLLDTGTTR